MTFADIMHGRIHHSKLEVCHTYIAVIDGSLCFNTISQVISKTLAIVIRACSISPISE
ncbi:MAG: hypothetical protein R2758_00670 [Bacteroidales bacterium]